MVKRGKKGNVLVMVAVSLLALLAFAGIVIDLGYMFVTQAQLQRTADAAALAGAGMLDPEKDPVNYISNARNSARTIALDPANKAGGAIITLDLNSSNDENGDIVVGYWSVAANPPFSAIVPTGKIANAVKVVARRTGETGTGIGVSSKVALFLGSLFGFADMSTRAQATAVFGKSLYAAPIPLCVNAANKTGEFFFVNTNLNQLPQPYDGAAWTLFSLDSNIGASDVRNAFFDTTKPAPKPSTDYCSQPCITTTNGTNVINDMVDAYNSLTFDALHKTVVGGVVTSWQVIIPIVDGTCPAGNCQPVPEPPQTCTGVTPNGCPPYPQGGNQEPYHISGWATATITEISGGGGGSNKGFRATVGAEARCVDRDPLQVLNALPLRLVK